MTAISDAIDETIRQLDTLHAARRERTASLADGLATLVRGIDVQWASDPEPLAVDPGRRRRPDDVPPAGSGPTLDGFDDPDLPRPRPGHAFGPAVRERLVRELLDDSGGSW